jgi:hypothetical protein
MEPKVALFGRSKMEIPVAISVTGAAYDATVHGLIEKTCEKE